jgi:hypothetical protein
MHRRKGSWPNSGTSQIFASVGLAPTGLRTWHFKNSREKC